MISKFYKIMRQNFKLKKKEVKTWFFIIVGLYLVFLYITQMLSYSLSPEYTEKANLWRLIKFTFRHGPNWGLLFWFTIVIAFLVVIGLWKKSRQLVTDERNFQYANNSLYGTARPADPEELEDIATISTVEKADGIILCRAGDTNSDKVVVHRVSSRYNNNIAVFGAPSSGKSYAFVETAIIQTVKSRRSIAVTDPKGELYNESYEYLLDNGYEVRRLDLVDLSRSDGWNCLEVIMGRDINYTIEQANIFANVVMENLEFGGNNTFYSSQKILLVAAILRVALGDDYKGRRTFAEAYKIINNFSREDLAPLFDENIHPEIWPASQAYRAVKGASDNAWSNIKSGLASALGIMQTPLVERITSEGILNTRELGEKPCAYFITMSNTHSTYRFLSALFFSYLYIDLVNMADRNDNGKLNVGVTFILDEFATIGIIPKFEELIASIRSRDLNTVIIIQDLTQLQEKYVLWNSILNCCSVKVGLGFNDPETAKFFSERSGEATTVVRSDKIEAFESMFKIAHDHTTGSGKRYVFNKDELERFKQDECLVILQGQNVLKATKFPKTAHPEHDKWRTINATKMIPAITKTKQRRKFYAQMADRVKAYYKEHPEEKEKTVVSKEKEENQKEIGLGELFPAMIQAGKAAWAERPSREEWISQWKERFSKAKNKVASLLSKEKRSVKAPVQVPISSNISFFESFDDNAGKTQEQIEQEYAERTEKTEKTAKDSPASVPVAKEKSKQEKKPGEKKPQTKNSGIGKAAPKSEKEKGKSETSEKTENKSDKKGTEKKNKTPEQGTSGETAKSKETSTSDKHTSNVKPKKPDAAAPEAKKATPPVKERAKPEEKPPTASKPATRLAGAKAVIPQSNEADKEDSKAKSPKSSKEKPPAVSEEKPQKKTKEKAPEPVKEQDEKILRDLSEDGNQHMMDFYGAIDHMH